MRRGVDVTVVVGSNRYGGDVVAKVSFSRDQLAEVLAPLEKLALEEAISVLSTSVTQKEVDARVAGELARLVGPARERAIKNARSMVDSVTKQIEKALSFSDPAYAVTQAKRVLETAKANVEKKVA